MKVGRAILVGILLAAVFTVSGCKRKKPVLPPPQANAPTITQPPPQPAPPPEETKPQPEVAPPAPQPTVEAPKPKPRSRRRTHVAKEAPKPAPKVAEKPSHTVIPEGAETPAAGAQLSIPGDATSQQKLTTAQLLEATDRNLKSINRPLSAEEQLTIEHIRSFMAQSRQATQDGDAERAYTLAVKAHLMSDAIAKR